MRGANAPSKRVNVGFIGCGGICGVGVPFYLKLDNCPVTWHVKGRYANGIRFQFVDAKNCGVVKEVSGGRATGLPHHGVYIIGEKGVVELYYDRVGGTREILLAAKASQNPLPVINNHYENWINCIQSRQTPISDWRSSVDGDLMFQLANIAIRSGKKVVWDPAKKTIAGDSSLVEMMSRPMREPFSLKTMVNE